MTELCTKAQALYKASLRLRPLSWGLIMPETVSLPGLASMVPAARRAVRGLLEGSPRADDAELIVSEFASNAIRYSRSGQPNGQFGVSVDRKPGWARVEVVDGGPLPAGPREPETIDEYGRGLLIVREVADRYGHDAGPQQAIWWAELGWEDEDQ